VECGARRTRLSVQFRICRKPPAGLQPAQCGGFDLGMLEGLAGKWLD
jgi:hypothetical protein